MDKAVVLLSGGIDSVITLYVTKQIYDVTALIFNYNQSAIKELSCAVNICENLGIRHITSEFDLYGDCFDYVPNRNMILISHAASLAETIGAKKIVIGINRIDVNTEIYPDVTGEFVDTINSTLSCSTKVGVEGEPIEVVVPLLDMSKSEIIKRGLELGVDYSKTWSCYYNDEKPCGECDSCRLRQDGFKEIGIEDPLLCL